MESYSFQEGEDIVIDVSSNKTIYDYWVELVIVKDGDIALGMHTHMHTYICMYMCAYVHILSSPPLQAHTQWCSLENSVLRSLFHSPPYLLYMLMAALLPYDSGILPIEAHSFHVKKLHLG